MLEWIGGGRIDSLFLFTAIAVPAATIAAALSPDSGTVPLADPLPDLPDGPQVVQLTDLVCVLEFPTDVIPPPDDSARLFVTEVDGVVRVIVEGILQAEPFLDFSAQGFVSNGSAMSGLAFHPNFAENRRLFVVMTENDDPSLADFGIPSVSIQQSVLYEVAALADYPDAGCNQIDPAATRELMRINEGASIHNLDDLAFGPDGYLYLSKGDDLTGGQHPSLFYGSVMRIDVDFAPGNPASANGEYAIPADNPFVGAGGAVVEEVWATGFRNPWRITFDGDDLWVTDVGENDIEEINLAVAGGNHGWNLKEGSFAALPHGVTDDLSGLPPLSFVDPVGQYDHGQFDRSITGGVVYRGSQLPFLEGRYLFGDWISGRLFSMDTETGAIESLELDPAGASIGGQLGGTPSEGVIAVRADEDGELLLVVTQRNSTATGRVLRVGAVTWPDLGSALAGVAGDPILTGTGPLNAGSYNSLELENAAPGAPAGLLLSLASSPTPLLGGVIVPGLTAPPIVQTTGATGKASFPFTLPAGIPAGTEIWAQYAVLDAAAVQGFALSNATMGTVP